MYHIAVKIAFRFNAFHLDNPFHLKIIAKITKKQKYVIHIYRSEADQGRSCVTLFEVRGADVNSLLSPYVAFHFITSLPDFCAALLEIHVPVIPNLLEWEIF